MNVRRLGSALRRHSLPVLMSEAGWRGIRSVRESIFDRRGTADKCPVQFRPIGYYDLIKEPVPVPAREAIVAYADAIVGGRYPLIGYGVPDLGIHPDWHCDWVSGKSWPLNNQNKLRIVRHDGSDIKAPWELSRLQFGPVVAKAFVLTGDRKYRDSAQALLTDWIAGNPIGKGIHWTIAMEAALRGISLCLTMDLLSPFTLEEAPWLAQMTNSLWQHLRFIEVHCEFSFLVRSNHYLSNLVGLTTLSAYLQGRGMKQRLRKYARAVNREILVQTYADGGDCEASTGYHVLVAQMFLHSYGVQQRSGCAIAPGFPSRLRQMFEWIAALADDAWKLPLLGDCDNGRVELEIDDISEGLPHALRVGSLCQRASQLLPIPRVEDRGSVRLLENSGIAVLCAGPASAVFCAMPNGIQGRGSHTHCDKLSVLLRLGQDEVFCDSGSRCYTRSAELRNLDRSTRAHCTLMVDETEQNSLSLDRRLLFQSGNEAIVSPIAILNEGELAARASHQGYARIGVVHQRTVQLSQSSLLVVDEVSGTGDRSLDLRFVLAPGWQVVPAATEGRTVSCVITGRRRLTLLCAAESPLVLSILATEISYAYGSSMPVSCIQIQTRAALPAKVQTRVRWD